MALASNALTTVARLVRELAIATPTNPSDAYAQLEDLISEVSATVESYLDRQLAKATRTEKVPAFDTTLIKLTHYPVTAVSAVTYQDAAVPTAEWSATPEPEDAAAGLLRNLLGVWAWTADFTASAAPEQHPGAERRLYAVTYTAGYVLPKDATGPSPRTLPYDIERAVLLTCVSEYRAQGRDPNIVSESLLSASVSYAGSTLNTANGRGAGGIIPDAAAMILDKHKRWA